MIQNAIHLGTFTDERAVLIGLIARDDTDDSIAFEQFRAIHILVGEDVALDKQDHWALQLGRVEGGEFKVMSKEIALDGALVANVVRRIEFASPVVIDRGQLLSIRLSPRGLPPQLVDLSVVLERGLSTARRTS